MSGLQAARMGDDVGAHTNALAGLVAGIVAGVVAGVVLGAILVATVATGGAALAIIGVAAVAIGGTISLAAVGGKIGKTLGASFPSGSPCSKVNVGSDDTFIEDKKAARALQDTSVHTTPQMIATGSSTVFVNDKMLARDTDSVKCGGKLVSHCQNVWIGGPPGGTPASEVPWWATDRNLGFIAMGGGAIAIAGSVLLFGGITTAVLAGFGYLGSKVGHFAGGLIGQGVDSLAGYTDGRFERFGEGVGEVAGGLAGGFGKPGRWQMAAANRVNGAVGNNRLTGTSLNREYLTRGADPPMRAMTENLSPTAREGVLAETARDPVARAQMEQLRTEGYAVRPGEGPTYTNPTTREVVTGPRPKAEEIVAPPRQEEVTVPMERPPPPAVVENRPFVKEGQGYEVDRLFMDHVTHEVPPEGWKMHVSANPNEAHAVADAVLPTLREMGVNHKVMANPEAYARMTGGQEGKFITIYPDNPAQAAQIANVLGAKLAGMRGPAVAGEMPIGESGMIYTRYGGFTKSTVTDPATGLEVPDVRGQMAPPWVENPFITKVFGAQPATASAGAGGGGAAGARPRPPEPGTCACGGKASAADDVPRATFERLGSGEEAMVRRYTTPDGQVVIVKRPKYAPFEKEALGQRVETRQAEILAREGAVRELTPREMAEVEAAGKMSVPERAEAAAVKVAKIEALRGDPELRDVVTPLELATKDGRVRSGIQLQEDAGGLGFKDLSPAAQARARDDMGAKIVAAGRALDTNKPLFADGDHLVLIDSNKTNFRFNEDGTIKAWFDPLAVINQRVYPMSAEQMAGMDSIPELAMRVAPDMTRPPDIVPAGSEATRPWPGP